MEAAILFAVTGFVMDKAHNVADHVFGQTDHQAENKAKPGWTGWSAIVGHVFDYHIVMVIMLMLSYWLLDISPSLLGFAVGLAFSIITHAVLDRRWPVAWILQHTGSPGFAKIQTPIWGMYEADQSLHGFCLWISALFIALL